MAHTACVTGGSGFIACELIKQLLEKGYHVRTTLRDTADTAKAQPLLRLAEALPGARVLRSAGRALKNHLLPRLAGRVRWRTLFLYPTKHTRPSVAQARWSCSRRTCWWRAALTPRCEERSTCSTWPRPSS